MSLRKHTLQLSPQNSDEFLLSFHVTFFHTNKALSLYSFIPYQAPPEHAHEKQLTEQQIALYHIFSVDCKPYFCPFLKIFLIAIPRRFNHPVLPVSGSGEPVYEAGSSPASTRLRNFQSTYVS